MYTVSAEEDYTMNMSDLDFKGHPVRYGEKVQLLGDPWPLEC